MKKLRSIPSIFFLVLPLFLASQQRTITPTPGVKVFPNGVSVPADYPNVNITVKTDPDPGLIFINNWGGTPYIAILDNNGSPVFYRKMPANARDFKVQANGMLSYRLSDPYYRFYEMDSSYTVTREITAKNGEGTDEHELQILPNGHALLIGLEYVTMDLSGVVPGGKTNATVIGNNVQEVDPAGNLVFEWKCWNDLKVTDAVHENLTASTVDFIHMNAITLDRDSDIVVSNRHLSEITKISRKTGKVRWRFGGAHNQFTILNDPLNGPSYQHDIRVLPNGNITMMDNGNYHSPSVSRAVEYHLDTVAMTATLVWQYRNVPDRFTWWMGNVQRLPSGNTLINWADASLPKLTEVTPAGTKVMELGFVSSAHSYRVFKFPWRGKPKAPVLTMTANGTALSVLLNIFDQRPSHRFLLYLDTLPNPTRLVDSTTLTAFDIAGLKNGKRYYLRASVRDSLGTESELSNEENALYRNVQPGDEMVVNGDFTSGIEGWTIGVTSPAAAVPYPTGAGELLLQIGNGGSQTYHVQLTQPGISLVNGLKYRFEFDAYATAARTLEPKVAMIAAPNTNYSKTSAVALTTAKKHFQFDFTMQDATDNNARVVMNCGLSDADVILDNISVKQLVPSSAAPLHAAPPTTFTLFQNYPNPFNPETNIAFVLPQAAHVTLSVGDVLGRTVAVPLNEWCAAGPHSIRFSALLPPIPSGIYFYTLTDGRSSAVKRMVILK